MLKQIQHKRFTDVPASWLMHNELLSLSNCYRCAQQYTGIGPMGNVNDSIRKRPGYIHS